MCLLFSCTRVKLMPNFLSSCTGKWKMLHTRHFLLWGNEYYVHNAKHVAMIEDHIGVSFASAASRGFLHLLSIGCSSLFTYF